MNYAALEKNLIDVLGEEQLKLGFCRESVRLYYPLTSLKHLLGTDCDAEEMVVWLEEFADYVRERLGRIEITHKGERFCFRIPEEGAVYVHKTMKPNEFIEQLIHLVGGHGCTMEQIQVLFENQKKPFHAEPVTNGEFDYLYYFQKNEEDPYYYCFKDEGCHVVYHRYLPEDYKDFGF